jgi:hypothetical protein
LLKAGLKSQIETGGPQQADQTGQTIRLAGLDSYAVLFDEFRQSADFRRRTGGDASCFPAGTFVRHVGFTED